ncbi:hypothetical protein E2C01_021452 [Portunus trituberculatus]|uniref:Uncharacterized protein n=1 Tax=Portunus trituberculatus TaxID=210409 RepID=A0A5B7E644_PORTR|nr:hypothetical protein [Portunus trituberculatus]
MEIKAVSASSTLSSETRIFICLVCNSFRRLPTAAFRGMNSTITASPASTEVPGGGEVKERTSDNVDRHFEAR